MGILSWILMGLIVGLLAKFIMPGKDPGGIIVTMLIGVGGSLIAGALGHALGWYRVGEGPGIFASIIGAIALLGVYRLVRPRHAVV
jgi:uncharacterized membrane protein YeaQ/YmgE (transglycosylase-associated protein family)